MCMQGVRSRTLGIRIVFDRQGSFFSNVYIQQFFSQISGSQIIYTNPYILKVPSAERNEYARRMYVCEPFLSSCILYISNAIYVSLYNFCLLIGSFDRMNSLLLYILQFSFPCLVISSISISVKQFYFLQISNQ